MPPIGLAKVLNVSSEDADHKAENLLECSFRKKWKSKSISDKAISVIFQLERPSNIMAVDVCNENSSFIEILVGNSSEPENFKVLLENSCLMTEIDAKKGDNINENKYFTKDSLYPGVRDEKWDLVKLICTQPFIDAQFGLVELKEHPSVVSITNRISTHVCDGTIISMWHVVTNCYCLAKVVGNWHKTLDPYDFKVIAGMIKREQIKDKNAQVRDLKIMIVHPHCKKISHGAIFDIGIIVVRNAFELTEYVSPADIGFYQEAHRYSEAVKPILEKLGSCSLVTWFSSENKTDPVVYKDDVQIKDATSCKNAIPKIAAAYRCEDCFFCTAISDAYGCTKPLSGAPIFCEKFFTGVIKTVENCSVSGMYVFSRIDTSMDWIGYVVSLGKSGRIKPCLSMFLLIFVIKLYDSLYNYLQCHKKYNR